MSQDDRIRQLTGLFLEDLRAPMEVSFRQLFEQVMAMAAEDLRAATNEAVARVGAEHQAALDAALAAAATEREQTLEGLRATLAAEHDAALEGLRATLTAEHDAALEGLRATLTAEHDAALETLRAQLTAQHEEVLGTERAQLGRQHQEAFDALGTELALRHGEALDALRSQTAAEHEAAIQELLRHREETIEAVRRDAAVERDAAVQAAREEMGRERDAARASVADLTDQLASARAQHEQLTQIAHAEADAAAELAGVAVEAHVTERQSELACSERVLAGMRALDEAASLSDVLTALADHAASDAVRVAVLLVHGTRLRGWRFAGMGDVHAATVEVPIGQAAIIGRAAELGAAVSSSEAGALDATALPSFLSTPAGRVGLALPVQVGGRVVAVLYADNAGSATPMVPSDWPELTEVLTRHAGRCLEVLTLSRAASAARPVQEIHPKAVQAVESKAPSSHSALVRETEEQEEEAARRHARLLISEIKLYNQELVERGRREGNLAALLHSEIERARRLYEEKIPAAVRQRVHCFDEEIVRTLADGDATLLGQVT